MPCRLSRLVAPVLLAIFWSAGAGFATAAPDAPAWFHRAWQTENGLPDNYISGVAQTRDGYLWVATKGGVLRFNGEKFTGIPQVNLPTMPSRTVRAMLRDRADRIWLAMERGPLLCVAPDGLSAFTLADVVQGQRAAIMMAEDREGAIWVAYPAQLTRFKEGQSAAIKLPLDLPATGLFSVASDTEGRLWYGKGPQVGEIREGELHRKLTLDAGVTIYPGARSGIWIASGNRLLKLEADGEPEVRVTLPERVVPRIAFEDERGSLWIGTASDGLFRFANNQLQKVSTSHSEVTCVTEDQEGNLYAGTAAGGLNLIRPRVVALTGRQDGLPFESVLSVSLDAEGWVWVTSQDGELARGREGNWELVSAAAHWPGGMATCVAADSAGVWVGTRDGGLHYFRDGRWQNWWRAEGFVGDYVRSLLVAANGDVWFATDQPIRLQRLRDGKIRLMQSGRRLGPIRAMAEGSDGTIWIGTSEGQIQRVSGDSLVEEPAFRETIPISVRSLLATADGALWIGFAGDGLGCLKDGKYTRKTTAAGLLDDFVSQLLADDRGNLWIAGNRGLSQVRLSELEAVMEGKMTRVWARAYGNSDGLPVLQPNRDYCPAVWRGKDGRMWFGMRNGLLMVEPHNIHDNPIPPPVVLERVSLDGQVVALYDVRSPLQAQRGSNVLELRSAVGPLRIPPDHRKLEFEFAALTFTSPENVQFRYRLAGFDDGWVDAGLLHDSTYPRLPAGRYEFHVVACNTAGEWNETDAALRLEVAPFVWETWWFRSGVALVALLFAGGSVFLVARRRYRRKLSRLEARRALEQERARIAKDIHDDLGASLTRITLLSQPSRGGPDDGETAIASLEEIHATSRQLTRSMEEVVWAVNPEHDTFDGLANYLSNYAQSFLRVAGVRCRLELPMQLPKGMLSAEVRHNLFLAFKEALNNVAKHANATEVRISLAPDTTGFTLLIEDNGWGLETAASHSDACPEEPKRPGHGNGLANMRSRLREIGGTCELQSLPGAGTKVTLKVNYKRNHELH